MGSTRLRLCHVVSDGVSSCCCTQPWCGSQQQHAWLQAPAYEPLSPTEAPMSPPLSPSLSPTDLPTKASLTTGHPEPLAALDRGPIHKAPDIRRLADLDGAGAPAVRSQEVREVKRCRMSAALCSSHHLLLCPSCPRLWAMHHPRRD